jgi:hypothetical protein
MRRTGDKIRAASKPAERRNGAMMKIVGVLIVLAAAYGAYHWLWGRGWFATSLCFLIWFLLASLYKPRLQG